MKRWTPLLVFLFALVVRLVYLYQSSASPAFLAPIVDAGDYDLLARQLAAGGEMESRLFWQPFFYPLFLSVVYAASQLGDAAILMAKLVQALLGALTSCLTFFLAARLFDRTTGLLAGFTTALYGPLILFETELLATGWAAFWSVALVLLFLKAADGPRPGPVFLLGLAGALSVLTRPSFLPYFVAAGLWLVGHSRRGLGSWRRTLPILAALVVGFAALSLPVALLNKRVTGHFGFLPGSGGLNTYIGNNADVCATLSVRPGAKWGELIEMPARHGITGYAERNRFFYGQVWDYLRRDPLGFSQGLLRKGVQLVSSRELPRNIDPYLSRQWSGLYSLLTWKVGRFGFPFGWLLPLAVLGVVLYRHRLSAPVLLFLALYPLAIVAVFVSARYRVPLVPVLSVPAAAGLLAVVRRFSSWRAGASLSTQPPASGPKTVALHTALLLGVVLLATLPGPFCEESLNMEADFFYCLGHAQNERGDEAGAIASYRQALASQPDLEEVHYNLGKIYSGRGDLEQAAHHYARSVAIDSDFAAGHNNLGSLLDRQGRSLEAIAHFAEAVRADPDYALAHLNLAKALVAAGRPLEAMDPLRAHLRLLPQAADAAFLLGSVYLQTGDPQRAASTLREALRLQPTARTHNELGTALVGLGKLKEAKAQFHAAIQLDPAYLDAYNNAGAAAAILGDFEGARDTFRQLVELAPKSADAHCNLGRVLAQLGDLDGARGATEACRRLESTVP